jgi:hypothetical protein
VLSAPSGGVSVSPGSARLRRVHYLPQPAPAGAIRHWCYPRPAEARQYPLGARASAGRSPSAPVLAMGAIRRRCYPCPAESRQYPLGAHASGALAICPSPRQRELSGTGATRARRRRVSIPWERAPPARSPPAPARASGSHPALVLPASGEGVSVSPGSVRLRRAHHLPQPAPAGAVRHRRYRLPHPAAGMIPQSASCDTTHLSPPTQCGHTLRSVLLHDQDYSETVSVARASSPRAGILSTVGRCWPWPLVCRREPIATQRLRAGSSSMPDRLDERNEYVQHSRDQDG